MMHTAGSLLAITGTAAAGIAAGATDPSSSVAPYVGGGAGVVAVMALGEVTRRLLNGRLIPRETSEHEHELGAYIVAAGQREDRAMQVAEAGSRALAVSAAEFERHTRSLATEIAALGRVVEDLRDEIRQARREAQG